VDLLADGTVKFYQPEKGWGAVTLDSGLDIWVHFSNVEMAGYRTLAVGQRVRCTYEMVQQDSFTARALTVTPLGRGGVQAAD
jgi:CspA family cold shock protein